MHMYGYEYYGGNGIVGAQVCTCMMLNLYTLTLVCIFSILFSIHFLRCCQEEFVQHSRGSLVAYHIVLLL